jgi:hypothetical protein
MANIRVFICDRCRAEQRENPKKIVALRLQISFERMVDYMPYRADMEVCFTCAEEMGYVLTKRNHAVAFQNQSQDPVPTPEQALISAFQDFIQVEVENQLADR